MAQGHPNTIKVRRYSLIFVALVAAPLLGYLASSHPKQTLLGAVAVCSGILLMLRPLWGVYALVVGTSFDSVSIKLGLATFGAGDLASLILIPAWLSNRLLRPEGIRWPHYNKALMIFLILSAVSLMTGVNPSMAYGGYIRVVVYAVTLVAIVDLVRTVDTLERIIILLAICSLLQALIGLYLPPEANGRIGGLVRQPNLLGAKIAFGVFPMASILLRTQRMSVRIACSMALVVMLLAVGLTISRGTYLALLVGGIFWLRHSPRMMILLGIAGGLAIFGLNTYFQERVERIEKRLGFDDSSVVNRGTVANNAIRAVLNEPLLGVGYGQFQDLDRVIEITAEAGRGGHNFYLSMAASAGLPAILALLVFCLAQARRVGTDAKQYREYIKSSGQPEHDGDGHSRAEVIRAYWTLSIFQAIMVYHAASLAVRGSQRLMEWTMFALYAAVALMELTPSKKDAESEPAEQDSRSDSEPSNLPVI